jgi:phenylacetate-coenzyme A ligase PaaK-like adenylate-forming protein
MVLSLSDLDQLGLMAMVLSRSAMIEASSGTSEQRAQLGRVSQEFYQNSEFVISLLRSALKAVR